MFICNFCIFCSFTFYLHEFWIFGYTSKHFLTVMYRKTEMKWMDDFFICLSYFYLMYFCNVKCFQNFRFVFNILLIILYIAYLYIYKQFKLNVYFFKIIFFFSNAIFIQYILKCILLFCHVLYLLYLTFFYLYECLKFCLKCT